jgi:hypothetical protein
MLEYVLCYEEVESLVGKRQVVKIFTSLAMVNSASWNSLKELARTVMKSFAPKQVGRR